MHVLASGGADSLTPTDCLLDSAANCSVVRNRNLLSYLHPCPPPVRFDGLGGALTIAEKGHLGSLCEAYYHPAATANIISFSSIKEQGHSVTYSDSEDSFIVEFGQQSRTFRRESNGLYVCDFSDPPDTHVGMTATVSDNASQYTKREISQATLARDLQHALANPPDAKLTAALDKGDIQGTRVTATDVRNATYIFGPNVDARSPPTRPQRIQDPQTMYADLFFVFKLA